MATISELSLPQLENILEGHSVGINVECFHDIPNSTHSLSPGRRRVLVAIIVFECFLAPVEILTGMMASEGEGWSLVFVWSVPTYGVRNVSGVFLLWLLLLPIGLILNTGMNPLGILDITNPSGARSGIWDAVYSCFTSSRRFFRYLQLFFLNGFRQSWTVDSVLVLTYRTYQQITCMARGTGQ
ncbi:hypothetical protein BELL_0108g00230 [Botrytis elliptica]|uniref:Uncharacterized protein n=1 Tax=Botrytis elliptica TaxID=278938 RepID=A0A4Z1JW82_9HELO|nr:hypothetical protein BELL_0108g00230 [Botrytis elliptica]